MSPQSRPAKFPLSLALILCTCALLGSCTEQNATDASTPEEQPCPVLNSHCTCSGEPYLSVTCRGLDDSGALDGVAGNLTERTLILQLESSNLPSFPEGVLRNPFLMSLIVRNSSFRTSLMSFPDPCARDDAVNVHHVVLENVTTGAWSWRHFAILKKLDVLFLYNSTIGTAVDSSFGDYVSKSLKMLSVSGSNLSSIEDGAFREFENLTYLRISFSKLRTLARNVFPESSKLQQLKLDHNQIQSLPTDMFHNFENLTTVSLSNNRISSLPEETYRPLAQRDIKLDLRGNPIKCDCRLDWLRTSPLRRSITGNCSSPKKLFGKKLTDLRKKDLRC